MTSSRTAWAAWPMRSKLRAAVMTPQPFVLVPQHRRARGADVVEEDLVDVAVAHHAADLPDGDAGGVHGDKEDGDAAVLGGVGVGAGEEEAELGALGVARPDLLTVDDVVVAVAHRPRLERREIGAGVGLAEPLAPDHVATRSCGRGGSPSARRSRTT